MGPENKQAEIESIHITRAENGFLYRVMVKDHEAKDEPSMKPHEYVYQDLEDVLKAVEDDLESPHFRGKNPPYPSQEKTEKAFKAIAEDEPGVVSQTRKKFGKERARKQIVAIALSKARGGLFK